MENPTLYLSFDKLLDRIIEDEKPISDISDIDPNRIISGASVSSISQPLGLLQSGKLTFTSSKSGNCFNAKSTTSSFSSGA